jgi:hypothetical protein
MELVISSSRDSGTSPIRLSPIIGENPEGILAKVQWISANWRKYRGYIGESSVDIRQLAKVQRVYWRKFSGYSPIGESTGGTLANIQGMDW